MNEEKVNVTEIAQVLRQDETRPPEVGEIINEHSKVFAKMMDGIISKHKNYAPVYFISVWTQKDPFSINVIKRKYIVRKTCPFPDWNSEVYSYDNRDCQVRLEWVLPSEQDSLNILKNKEIYDKQLVGYIQDFNRGKLKVPAYSPD